MSTAHRGNGFKVGCTKGQHANVGATAQDAARP
jgi:hypothetical protein